MSNYLAAHPAVTKGIGVEIAATHILFIIARIKRQRKGRGSSNGSLKVIR